MSNRRDWRPRSQLMLDSVGTRQLHCALEAWKPRGPFKRQRATRRQVRERRLFIKGGGHPADS